MTVPAGNTGLEPTKTSFFQALNINTKITKGTVEILKDEHIIKAGDKVFGFSCHIDCFVQFIAPTRN